MSEEQPKVTVGLVEEDTTPVVDTRPNCLCIRYGMYLVRTQAGFRKAVRDFADSEGLSRDTIDKYPSAYPCLVMMHTTYNGSGYDISVRVWGKGLPKESLTLKSSAVSRPLRAQGEIE